MHSTREEKTLAVQQNSEGEDNEPFNLKKLYTSVCRRGGYQAVTNRNDWDAVGMEINGSNSQFTDQQLKQFYRKRLYAEEQKNYFNNDQARERTLPIFLTTFGKRPLTLVGGQTHTQGQSIQSGQPAQQSSQGGPTSVNQQSGGTSNVALTQQDALAQTNKSSSLAAEVTRCFEEEEKAGTQYFLNKQKLMLSRGDLKRILLGLNPFMPRRDSLYSLNQMLLQSCNGMHCFLFEQHERIFSALTDFIRVKYSTKSKEDVQMLRTATLIVRNLAMNPLNLKYLLGKPLFGLLVEMLNTGSDSECNRNIIETMHGLVKVGWDCHKVLQDLNQAVIDDKVEDVDVLIELLRGLIDERDDSLTLVAHAGENVGVFEKLLVNPNLGVDLKQKALQILAFAADASPDSRLLLSRSSCLMPILICVLKHMRQHEKLAHFAALTLSSLCSAPDARAKLRQFEGDLAIIGFSDETLGGLIAGILSDIAAG